MDAVTLKVAKNYTNEQAAQKATNSPVEEISFDGGIYSVGNDVVNGQVSDVKIKGLTATNLIKNGNFVDGATGWEAITGSISAANNILSHTSGNYASNICFQDTTTPIVSGHKYYIAVKLRVTNSVCDSIYLQAQGSVSGWLGNSNIINSPAINTWYTVKGIVTAGSQTTNLRIAPTQNYANAATAKGKVMEIQEVMAIELIGEDLSLTVDQLNAKYSNWFDGTKSTNSVRIRSVNEDETKESMVNVNLSEPLRSLPNGTYDEISVSDGKLIKKIGSKVNVASGTVINYADMVTSGQFVAYYADGTQQIGVKGDTLTALAITLTYQLATPIVTKLPAQAPLQVFENGTVYVEPIGDSAESTLPSVEMTIPTGTSNKFGVASHDYDGTAADWALTNSESKCFMLAVSSAGGAANIIAPNRPGTMYAISNASGYAITIKKSGGTGVAVTNAKTVLVIHNGADYTALTAEL